MEETFPPPVEESYAPPPVEESYVQPPVEEAFAPPVAAGAEPTLGPITPDQPALVLFVLDRSVDDPFSGNMKNACVRLQQHLGDVLEQITRDHSLLQEQLDSGIITREEARVSEHKNWSPAPSASIQRWSPRFTVTR